MKTAHIGLCLLVAVAACKGPDENEVSRQDAQGNYITTSDYESMQRTEFNTAMEAGLRDFDEGLDELRERANELGGESLEEFSEHLDELRTKRTDFVNEMKKGEVALDDEWPDRREDTLESYYAMRDSLAEAYDEVLDA